MMELSYDSSVMLRCQQQQQGKLLYHQSTPVTAAEQRDTCTMDMNCSWTLMILCWMTTCLHRLVSSVLMSSFLAEVVDVRLLLFLILACPTYCLQCFDTVGWASGRASGLACKN